MDVGNTYRVRNKLESDVGEAVDVTETVSLLNFVGAMLRQPASRIKATKKTAVWNLISYLYLSARDLTKSR